jgi:hypothetical protein
LLEQAIARGSRHDAQQVAARPRPKSDDMRKIHHKGHRGHGGKRTVIGK